MAYRYTNNEKWSDSWFSELKPNAKLLFVYLYENCDIAGFIELNIKRWASDIGLDRKQIEGALEGLQRGLIYSNTGDCIYIRTFLRHQKNLPLTPEKNPAHKGIFKRFDLYKSKFFIEDVNLFIKGALEGLNSPYGNGNNVMVNSNGKESVKTSFEKPSEDLTKVKKSKEENNTLPDSLSFIDHTDHNTLLVSKWHKWCEFRKLLKRPYKTTPGAAAAYNKLLKLADDNSEMAIQIIDQSIENEWLGFFPLKTVSRGVKSSVPGGIIKPGSLSLAGNKDRDYSKLGKF